MWDYFNSLDLSQVAVLVLSILTIIAIKIGLKSCSWNFKKFWHNLLP